MKRKAKSRVKMMDPKVLMAYDRWVAKHLDEMSSKYPHKVIAVYRGKLIAVSDSFKKSMLRPERRASRSTPSPWKFQRPRTHGRHPGNC